MDRTEELTRATQLFQSIDRSKKPPIADTSSPFLSLSNRVSTELDQNGKLVQKMHALTERKEFSNDPIHEMKKISTAFQSNITNIEADLARLKRDAESNAEGNQSCIQHRKLILDYLDKLMRKHVNSFKGAVKVYATNVEERNKRVGNKYGQTSSLSALTSENAGKYAMFSTPLPEPVPMGSGFASELRNRRGGQGAPVVNNGAVLVPEGDESGAAEGEGEFTEEVSFDVPAGTGRSGGSISSSSGADARGGAVSMRGSAGSSSGGALGRRANSGPTAPVSAVLSAEDKYDSDKKYGKGKPQPQFSGWMFGPGAAAAGQQQQQQLQKGRREVDRYRLQQAEQAESTIAQMGQLFAQMATLVSEQAETIARIEDDVEAGLQDTLEAQGHLQNVYEITKGNRGLILKIFALLVLFIFLFLVWT